MAGWGVVGGWHGAAAGTGVVGHGSGMGHRRGLGTVGWGCEGHGRGWEQGSSVVASRVGGWGGGPQQWAGWCGGQPGVGARWWPGWWGDCV